ncbi:hypothetical protein M9978_16490 [Sphingomonas sp. MG17]|uniref:Uncharacterized protein n=1 Tax=Sphingomonas tagetis TaxID=2949092 RepID=A0A9X2KMP6_9SPHN|nr:hypothetical protein [Sphingomonas tagetis]MCP3732025.1 hypothetical protein [Sphingomonas tagetis]
MAENRRYSCCLKALDEAQLRDFKPTREDIAWLFSMSPRWVGELRKRGVFPRDATLPQLVKIMARYKSEARQAGSLAARERRRNG